MTDSMQMPQYQCHKKVWALEIVNIKDPTKPGNESDGSLILVFETPYAPIRVDHEWVRSKKPEQGGYYVQYEDGYTSFSPKKAFEEGYTRV